MGLDQSLFTKTGEEAYFRKQYVLHVYFSVHSFTYSDPDDKWAMDEKRINVSDVERLVSIAKILLKAKDKSNFIAISRRLSGATYSDDEDFGENFIDGLEQVIEQIPPILKLNPEYFLYSAG